MTTQSPGQPQQDVASSDVRRLVGDVDDATVAAILALRPSLGDLEDVSACLAGDQDVLARRGHHVPPLAGRILDMLEEQPPRRER
jgi:hypothetical protein